MPKQQLAIAARAAGILPLGFIGTVADYKDLDAFRETVRRSRRLGFRGASVIHPAQIPILNEEFAPGADEVASAQQDRRGLRRGGRGRARLDFGRRQDDRRAGRAARAGDCWRSTRRFRNAKRGRQNEQTCPNTNSSPSATRRARRGARTISSAAIRTTGRCRWIISSGSRRARSAPSSSTAASPRRPRRSASARSCAIRSRR